MKNLLKKIIPKSCLFFYHKLLAILAAYAYNFPSRKMVVIGVTGTNGKTTVCNMIAKILEEAGYKVGLTTTANFKIGEKEWINATKQTMQGRFKLQKLLHRMAEAGCKYAIIETSSEGIAQSRHWGISYDVAVFTNLTPEHIESHGSFEKYKEAKGKLFKSLKQKNARTEKKENKKVSIVNLDDPNADYFLSFDADEKYGYELSSRFEAQNLEFKADDQNLKLIKTSDYRLSSAGSQFSINGTEFNLKLLGKFNIYNALAAICVGLSQNINLQTAKSALERIKQIPGRMELINEGQNFKVIVDYAHEPASLEQVFQTIRPYTRGKMISVLGSCGGGRDKSKRSVLGKLAAQYTDLVIVTNEDPYDENPKDIIDAVAFGAENFKKGVNLRKILDRQAAIKEALNLASPGDVVIITGKGSEQCIMSKDSKKIPWDDREVARKILKERIKQESQNKTDKSANNNFRVSMTYSCTH